MADSSAREFPVFDIRALLLDAWEVFKANALMYLAAILFYFALVSAGQYCLWVAGTILNGPLLMGLMKMAQCGARREPVRFADMFIGFEYFLPTLILGVVCHALLFVVGVGWVAFFLALPAFLFILESECGAKCALTNSWDMVQSNIREWLLLSLILAGLNVIGVVICFVTLPLSMIVVALAYDQERAQSKAHIHGMANCSTPAYPSGDAADNA